MRIFNKKIKEKYLYLFSVFFCLKLIEENINSKIENLERKAAENEIVLKQLEKNYKLLLSKERVKERLKDKSINSKFTVSNERFNLSSKQLFDKSS